MASKHGGLPAFALLDDRKTHTVFLKTDPPKSSTNLLKGNYCWAVFSLLYVLKVDALELNMNVNNQFFCIKLFFL